MTTTPSILLTNNATTTLAGPITNVATTATLAAGTGTLFPAPSAGQSFPMTLITAGGATREIVKVTARATDTITIVRAQEGTVASAFAAGDVAALFVTAGTISAMSQVPAEQTATSQIFLLSAGLQKLNNGLIFQWGRFSTTTGIGETVTFPQAFPSACLGVTACEAHAAGWAGSPPIPTWVGPSDVTAANFKIWAVRMTGGTPVYSSGDETQWFAWGH